jgi:hypothetical protein
MLQMSCRQITSVEPSITLPKTVIRKLGLSGGEIVFFTKCRGEVEIKVFSNIQGGS